MSLLLVEWSIEIKRSGIGISRGGCNALMVYMMLISSTEPTIIKNGFLPASAGTLQQVGWAFFHEEASMLRLSLEDGFVNALHVTPIFLNVGLVSGYWHGQGGVRCGTGMQRRGGIIIRRGGAAIYHQSLCQEDTQ